mmetsp:Transcript_19249/g.20688  ORF Transcript_19249/g.20688 Transcript_19249/m.20688 type:complete len:115 (-) Transcript_19249:82-426(-)
MMMTMMMVDSRNRKIHSMGWIPIRPTALKFGYTVCPRQSRVPTLFFVRSDWENETIRMWLMSELESDCFVLYVYLIVAVLSNKNISKAYVSQSAWQDDVLIDCTLINGTRHMLG